MPGSMPDSCPREQGEQVKSNTDAAEGKRIAPGTPGYFWALFALGLTAASIGPALPRLAEGTGVSLGAVSLVFAAYRGGFIVGSLGGGSLLDRLRGNRVLTVILLVLAVTLALVPHAPSLVLLVGLFLTVGIAAGVVEIGGNTLLLWSYGSRVGPYMNGLHFAFGVGAILSPLLIGRMLEGTGNLSGAFLLAGAFILPGAVLLFRATSPSAPGTEGDGEQRPRVAPTLFTALFLLFYVGAESGFGGWLYTFAVTLELASPAQAGAMTSLFWGALTAGRLVLIPFSNGIHPGRILLGSVAGCLVFLGVLALPVASGSVAVLWIASGGVGLSMAGIFPGAVSFAGRHMRVTGKVSRWFFAGAGFGGMSIPWILGQMVEYLGAASVMGALLLVSMLMALALAGLLFVCRAARGPGAR